MKTELVAEEPRREGRLLVSLCASGQLWFGKGGPLSTGHGMLTQARQSGPLGEEPNEASDYPFGVFRSHRDIPMFVMKRWRVGRCLRR